MKLSYRGSTGLPVGAFVYAPISSGNEPSGQWGKAGEVIAQARAPVLFSLIGQTYSDGSYSTATHFRLPPSSFFTALTDNVTKMPGGDIVTALILLG